MTDLAAMLTNLINMVLHFVIVDTVMMMSSYSDAVVIRHPQPGAVAVGTRCNTFPIFVSCQVTVVTLPIHNRYIWHIGPICSDVLLRNYSLTCLGSWQCVCVPFLLCLCSSGTVLRYN